MLIVCASECERRKRKGGKEREREKEKERKSKNMLYNMCVEVTGQPQVFVIAILFENVLIVLHCCIHQFSFSMSF